MGNESDRNSFGDSRSDVLVLGLDGSMIIIDVRSTDVSKSSNGKLAPSYNSPLRRAEEAKIIKYAEKINNLNSNSHTQFLLCPFAFSVFRTLSKTSLSFIDDFYLLSNIELEEYLTELFGKTELYFLFLRKCIALSLAGCYH
ncbi:hypothetical protein P9112_012383 [Eukaryota sp. TZLM1-RC]